MKTVVIILMCFFAYIVLGMIFYVFLLKFNSTRYENNRLPEESFLALSLFWPAAIPVFIIIYGIMKLWKFISPILFKIFKFN